MNLGQRCGITLFVEDKKKMGRKSLLTSMITEDAQTAEALRLWLKSCINRFIYIVPMIC